MNRRQIAVTVVAALTLLLVPAALAAKGGNSSKPAGGGGTSSTSSISGPVMVVDHNANGAANWNDQVTFNVSTTATDRPYVLLNCYQSGTWVSTATGGFFPESPWAPNFTLSSGAWTSGAGDCTATLYLINSHGRTQNLASFSFHVDA